MCISSLFKIRNKFLVCDASQCANKLIISTIQLFIVLDNSICKSMGVRSESHRCFLLVFYSFICSATYELFSQKHCFVIEPPVGRGAVSMLSFPWGRT